MTSELYINGELVDLDQKSVVALSFAVNTLNELKTLNGNVSNRVTLPKTAHNLRLLGFVGDTNIVLTKTARKKQIAKYVQNGTEIIPEGVAEIGTENKKGIGLIITSGNVDFFDLIEGSVRSLRFPEYDHIFGNLEIAASRLNREGYIYPIVNYGDMTDASAYININTMRPAMFIKSLVDKIVKNTGFQLINELETDPRTADQYARMILPFANDSFIHGQRFIDVAKGYEFRIRQVALPRTYNTATGAIDTDYALVKYDTVILDDSGAISDDGIYNAPGKFVADFQVTIPSVKFPSVGSNRTRTLQLVVKNEFDAVTVLAEAKLIAPAVVPSYDYQNIVLKAQGIKVKDAGLEEKYYLRFASGAVGTDLDMIVDKPITFTVTAVGSGVAPGDNVEMEATLPDIAKKDLLKAVANWFGGIVQTDNQNKIVHIVPFFKIVDNVPFAVDWSDKVVNPDEENNEIRIGEYGQENVAVYKNDNSIEPEDYASGSFPIADENLTLSKELFELPVSASYDGFVLSGVSAVLIKKIETEGGTEMSISTEPRIAMVDFVNTEVNYRTDDLFSNVVTDSIPRTYFDGSGVELGLTLQEILNRYYPEIISMLNDQRKKTLKLFLREPDIASLDFFIPVYLKQYSAYFYISKISDYVGERPCAAELIKLY